MADLWQVPLERPYALGDAGMLMLGLRQNVPAPGARAARAEALRHEARARSALAHGSRRGLRREAGLTFVDYAEAFELRKVTALQQQLLEKLRDTAGARQAAGGALADVAAADAELAVLEAEVAAQDVAIDMSRERLNVLMRRAPGAPLGDPVWTEDAPQMSSSAALESARRQRPERDAARAERDARRAELRAEDREATWPEFSVAGLYFAPVGPATEHGYGVSASMSLPWLWGGAGHRRDAQRASLDAAEREREAVELAIARDVTTALAKARSLQTRSAVLEQRALPASVRAAEAARVGYQSGRAELMSILEAERRVVQLRLELVRTRAELERAIVELEWAIGEREGAERESSKPRRKQGGAR
jgi:outer membrane protein TolC